MKRYLTKITCSTLLILVATLAAPALAELAAPTFDKDDSTISSMEALAKSIGTMDEEIGAEKKLLVADNMSLTDVEAKVFWPIYETYQKELHQINERLAKVINAYALEYKKGALLNETAKKLLNEALAIELAEVKLKQSYVSKFGKAFPVAKVARYIQIETKMQSVLYHELAGKIPLVK
jgi:hypothetical protein